MSSDPNDRRAQVLDFESISEDELFEYMTRQGSSITKAEAKANYEEITSAFDYFLKQGYGINTEFLVIHPVIHGVFRDEDDKFDPKRHKIKFKATLGRRFNHVTDDVKVEKISPPNNLPLPVTVDDLNSGTSNDVITPGGVATLTGTRLKFNQKDLKQGIFLIDSTQNEYRIENLLSHTGSKIILQFPAALAAGEYSLEVRYIPAQSKKMRTGKLTERLTVYEQSNNINT
jgi:hypothetical protein